MICIPKPALEIQDLSLPATVLLPRLDDSVPKGTLLPQCSKRNTAPEFLEIGPLPVSFPVIIMTLCKNRYRTGTMSLTVCLGEEIHP